MSERRVAVSQSWQAFHRWRQDRPFWGGALLILSAVFTGYLPAVYDRFLIFPAGSFTTTALLFALLLLLCGVTVLTFPSVSGLFGFLGMLVSTLALLGALGGFLIGSILGGLGGVLSFAWKPPEQDGRFSWEGDDDGDEE
ncbi:MAG: DUF6114 domain-containing protein [Halorientalis sp.]